MFRSRTLGRLVATTGIATVVCGARGAQCQYESELKHKSADLDAELRRIRQTEREMRARWVKDEENWRKLPPRAWPAYQPNLEEVPQLKKKITSSCGTDPKDPSCLTSKFDLATAYVFNQSDVMEGMQLYESNAKLGDADSLTALGICYLEGLGGISKDVEKGVRYIQQAVESGSTQALFELGVLYYMGNAAPVVEEDVATAFRLFQQAAVMQHSAGLYMTADMLMLGEGCSKDFSRGIRLLYEAAERGHRFARQTLLEVLKEDSALHGAAAASQQLRENQQHQPTRSIAN